MSADSAPVRIGIVGCGNVLGAYLTAAEPLTRAGQAEVVALCGSPRHRDQAGKVGPGCAFTTEYPALLGRADLDLVIILTPMPQHAAMAGAALAAGKHVLLEKPMATTLEDARMLLAQAERSGRHLLVAPFTVLSPTFQRIASRLQTGDIGTVISARGRYGWAGPDWSAWFYEPGGGALFDLGVYNLTTLTGWLGPVRRVTALAGIAIPERRIGGRTVKVQAQDNVQVLLEFAQGCLAALTTSFAMQQYSGPGLELYGTEGTIYLRGDDWDPDGYEVWQNTAACWQYFKETAPDWSWTDGLRHLVECIRSGRRPVVSPAQAYHVLEVMLAALASSRDGTARLIQSTFTPVELELPAETLAPHRVHDRTRKE